MRESNPSEKKPIEEVQAPRARKPKLERVSRDVTKHKRAEEALRESEERFRSFAENAPDFVIQLDREGMILFINRMYEDVSVEQVAGTSIFTWLEEQYRPAFRTALSHVFETAGSQVLEYEALGPESETRWYSGHIGPIKAGERIGSVVLIARDITEHKKAAEALRQSREKLRKRNKFLNNVLESLTHPFYVVDANDYTIKMANSAANFGSLKEGPTCYALTHNSNTPCCGEKHLCPLKEIKKTKKPVTTEHIHYDKDGKERYIEIHGHPIFDSRGNVHSIIEYSLDITKRKEAEEALRLERDNFVNILDSMEDGVYIVDQNHDIQYVNPTLKKEFGPFEGRKCYEYFHDRKEVCPWCKNEEVFAGKTVRWEWYSFKNQKTYDLIDTPLRNPDGSISKLEIFRDITERKQAEKKLLEYQAHLKSLASQLTLAEERERRRIATELHDQISQSLVISKLKLETLRESASSVEFGKTLEEVCNSLGKTIADTRSLTFDLSSPILYELGFEAAVAEWLTEQIDEKYGIAAEFEDDEQLKPLDDDIKVLLFRDVRELLINVVKHAHASKVSVSIRKVDREVQVSVEDDGVGFNPAEVAATAARRAEFGLFSIRERLGQIGGQFEIESKPGCGSRVTMMAPLKDEKNAEGRKI